MPVLTYKDAGVDVSANTRWIGAIKAAMTSTYGPRVCADRHGGFAGSFRLDYDEQLFRRNYEKPVLVACTDGVGTKVLVALQMKDLSTVGIDLVAMSVNDLITTGAEPLLFLDYLAVNKLEPKRLLEVVEGIAAGCRESGCSLLGGETAEMPDLYKKGDLDLAGFAVGVVEHGKSIDGSRIKPGDVVVGLASSGIHSNGYSLVRKLVAQSKCKLDKVYDDLGEPLGDALLRPTKIYVRAVLSALGRYKRIRVISGMAHITGGGLKENVARALPSDCDAVLKRSTWRVPPVFDFLQGLGVTRQEMYKVFNMGIGYVLMVRPRFVAGVMSALEEAGETPMQIGVVKRGAGRVTIR